MTPLPILTAYVPSRCFAVSSTVPGNLPGHEGCQRVEFAPLLAAVPSR
jgi:hypothetical protein